MDRSQNFARNSCLLLEGIEVEETALLLTDLISV
jgi:hypothetical protein